MKNKAFNHRLSFALNGLKSAFTSEKSFRFQVLAAVGALVVLLLTKPGLMWVALIILLIALVLAAELFNTAIEHLCDFVEPEHHEKIKIIKDVAAGGVLVISAGAVLIGVLFLVDLMG